MLNGKLGVIKAAGLGVLAWALLTSTTQANIIFNTSGSTSGGSVSGTADFTILASTLDVTITNTTNPVNDLARVLDGLAFTLVGGSGLTLTSVTAAGFVDCTSGTCTSVGTFHDYHSGTNVGSPYTWSLAGTAPYHLFAGDPAQSFHPGGIVDSFVTGADGIPNDQHNDFLLGPVTFAFSFTTAPTDVTSATFYWGTVPETTTSTRQCVGNNCGDLFVPEPGSIALVGLALSGLAFVRRRVKA
jgi:hypothetical protein